MCKGCGRTFEAEGESTSRLCPECAEKSRKESVLRLRTCARCGAAFMGYPRSKYCEPCREEAAREANRKAKQRKIAGKTRALGSIDHCESCGKEYTVKSGLQRYCPDCAAVIVPDTIRAHKREYNKEHRSDRAALREERRQESKVCIICGKTFTSLLPTVTCSPECEKEAKRRRQAKADAKRRSSKK